MAMSMEDILEKGFVTEQEPLVIHSRSALKTICQELGITNEQRVGNEYSALVNYQKQMDRQTRMGDIDLARQTSEHLTRMIESWKEDEAVTAL